MTDTLLPTRTASPVRGRRPVDPLDRMWLGAVTSSVTGPLDLPALDDLRAALVLLGRAGPDARAGLRLAPGDTHWDYDPAGLEAYAAEVVDVLPSPGAPSSTRVGAALPALAEAGTALDVRPLQVRVVDVHLVLTIRHALGDAKLLVGLISGLLSTARTGVVPDWVHEDVQPHPLRAALREFFWTDRRRVRALLQERWAARRTAPGPAAPAGEPRPFVPAPALAFARGTDASRRELMAWRKAYAPDASMAAVSLAVSRAALLEVGLPVADPTLMVYDARRYLPRRAAVHGNFISGLDLHSDRPNDPESLTAAVDAAGESGRPLAAMALGLARHRLRRSRPATAPLTVSGTPTARVAYNFMGRQMPIDRLAFSGDPEGRCFTAQVLPASAEGISVCLVQTAGGLQYGLSFHDGVFDRALVQRATELAADVPVDLLEAHRGATP